MLRALVLVLVACSAAPQSVPANRAPATTQPAQEPQPRPEPENPVAEDVVVHDTARIEELRRRYREDAQRRAALEEFRAKLKAGKIVCTTSGSGVHGWQTVCTEVAP